MDPGFQLVEYACIALDNIHAEIVDMIQFRRIDKYVEAAVAVFFQEVQEFRGWTAVEVTRQFQVQAVARAVLENSEIVGHGVPPFEKRNNDYESTKYSWLNC